MKGLLPHIRQFVRVRQALVGAEALGASLTDLLDSSRMGVIYLDRRGLITEANDRARRILRHGDGLSDRGGELRARNPADQARLEQLLAAVLPSAGTVPVSGSMLLHRAALALPLVMHVKPVGCMDRLEIEPWEEIALPEGFAVNIAGWLSVSHTVILRQSVLETLHRLYRLGRDQM